MTSLTTILALIPFLGTDLQKPLELAVIGGMLVITVVNVYFDSSDVHNNLNLTF